MQNNKKIKICHIASADITVKFLLLSQLKFLKQQGYDVYAISSPGKWIKQIENEGIKIKTISIKRRISPLSDLVALIKLFFYFKKEKFDIVHTHTPKPGLIGQMAAKVAGVPIVINTIHGLYFGNKFSKFKKDFYLFIEKMSAKFSDLIFSQNKEDLATIKEKSIAPNKRVEYLGNGIDTAKFSRQRFSKEFLYEKKGKMHIPDNAKIVGCIGRLVKEKGYLELFSAFEKVVEVLPETFLLVIGPEDEAKKDSFDRSIIKNYKCKDNVVFLGEREDVDEIYPLMDVFVLASRREGFPRTIIEAMSEEVPVIATDIRGCREAIDNGKNGILVPMENSEELARQIIFILSNKDKAAELAQNARQKAVRQFDEKKVFEKIKAEYQNFLNKV